MTKMVMIGRVLMLSEMVKEVLEDCKDDVEDYNEWRSENRDKSFQGPPTKRTNPTEIKRLMLVLRQETLRLEKLL